MVAPRIGSVSGHLQNHLLLDRARHL